MADLSLGAARSFGDLLKTGMFTIWAVKVLSMPTMQQLRTLDESHLPRGRYIQVLPKFTSWIDLPSAF